MFTGFVLLVLTPSFSVLRCDVRCVRHFRTGVDRPDRLQLERHSAYSVLDRRSDIPWWVLVAQLDFLPVSPAFGTERKDVFSLQACWKRRFFLQSMNP